MLRILKNSVSWGSVAAYSFFVLYIAMIGIGAALHWRALDIAFAVLSIVALALGSAVVIWRAWRHHGEPGSPRLGQLAALPRCWRKWVLGERNDGKPNSSSKRTR